MNANVRLMIEENIETKFHVLDLSGSGLSYIELPIEELGHLLEIDLSNNSLEYLPDNLVELTVLESVNISNNKLISLPDNVGNWSELKQIHLHNNYLQKLPETVGNWKELNHVELQYNQLSSLPESVKNWKKLDYIELSNNKFINLSASVGSWIKLTVFEMRRNPLTKLPDSIGQWKSITEIDLSKNKLTVLPESVKNWKRLMSIDLSDNKLVELPEGVEGWKWLESIYIRNNNLTQLPEGVGSWKKMVAGFFENNKLSYLPESVGNWVKILRVYFENNQLTSLPESIRKWKSLTIIELNHNKLIKLPEYFGELKSLLRVNLSYNLLEKLPVGIRHLKDLEFLSIRNNKFEHFPDEMKSLIHSNLVLDYHGNPFVENALARSERFMVIWKNVPYRLREIMKIYFDGFNIFYNERTQKVINLKVFNEEEGLVFDLENKVDSDPELVETLLNEYYEILKDKLQEGVSTGLVFTKSTDDTAHLFAQQQASYLAQNATLTKLAVKENISNSEVISSVFGFIESMEDELHKAWHTNTSLNLKLQDKNIAVARLEERTEAYEGEILHRRQEALTRAGTPMQISMSQQMTLTNQVSTDFGKLRELLDDYLSRFQREEASKLQEKIDTVAAKPSAATAEEKKVLGSGLKRWLESVQGSLKAGTEIAKSATELSKYWDKLKDFSETVLNDPQLGDTIESVKKMIEGAM